MMSPTPDDPNQPYPGAGSAVLLTLMATFASAFTTIAFLGVGPLAAFGIGRAIGVGSVASMAAQRVGEPQAARLGMRRLDQQTVPLILCLIPAVLLMSELDNIAYDWTNALAGTAEEATLTEEGAEADDYDKLAPDDREESAPDEEGLSEAELAVFDPEDPASLTQAAIVLAGIIPIVDCFLVFGVIQQGLVRRMGFTRGLGVTASLWMLMRLGPTGGLLQFVVAAVAYVGLGYLLGLLRIATSSLLGPMLLASGWAAIQFLALATVESAPLPGLNTPGTHLPILVTLGSTALVAWASWTLFESARARHVEDDVWRGPGDRLDRPGPRANGSTGGGAEIHPFPPVPRPRHLDDDEERGA